MAQITMTLSGGISLSTDMNTDKIKMAVNDRAKTVLEYKLSISKFSFHKKMYQPTEIVADINIIPSAGKSTNYQEISREALEDKFKHAKVMLKEGTFSIGDDFYVHEVLPHYGKDSMSVTLKIYSPDKLLTIREASAYFNLGTKRLRRLAEENTGRFAVYNGSRCMIIRPKFEEFLAESSAI